MILHTTTIEELLTRMGEKMGDVVEQKLRQFQDQSTQVTSEYLTRKEVSRLLKISLATLSSYTREGRITGYKIGGRVLYRRDEIEDSLQSIQALKFKHGGT